MPFAASLVLAATYIERAGRKHINHQRMNGAPCGSKEVGKRPAEAGPEKTPQSVEDSASQVTANCFCHRTAENRPFSFLRREE
jgi:hypothetical protein